MLTPSGAVRTNSGVPGGPKRWRIRAAVARCTGRPGLRHFWGSAQLRSCVRQVRKSGGMLRVVRSDAEPSIAQCRSASAPRDRRRRRTSRRRGRAALRPARNSRQFDRLSGLASFTASTWRRPSLLHTLGSRVQHFGGCRPVRHHILPSRQSDGRSGSRNSGNLSSGMLSSWEVALLRHSRLPFEHGVMRAVEVVVSYRSKVHRVASEPARSTCSGRIGVLVIPRPSEKGMTVRAFLLERALPISKQQPQPYGPGG
jgi:hypothetical protein